MGTIFKISFWRGFYSITWWLFGLTCVLVDLDHVLVLVKKGLPITLENLARHAGRPGHVLVVYFGWVVVVLCGALFVGLFFRLVRRKP